MKFWWTAFIAAHEARHAWHDTNDWRGSRSQKEIEQDCNDYAWSQWHIIDRVVRRADRARGGVRSGQGGMRTPRGDASRVDRVGLRTVTMSTRDDTTSRVSLSRGPG